MVLSKNLASDKEKFESKIGNIFLSISLSKCIVCSKEPSHCSNNILFGWEIRKMGSTKAQLVEC